MATHNQVVIVNARLR